MKLRTQALKLKRMIPALLALFLLSVLPVPADAEECTTAVVSGSATPDGRPLLWKNRDTDEPNNKLVYLADGPLTAIGLVSVGSSTSVWMGVNEAGFAIENSDSADLEGTSNSGNGSFMRQALLNCATVAAFETLLLQTNATGRTTQANYGVIDATGAAAMFEVGNHTYRKYDAADPTDAPNGFIVRTNFAFTGDGSGAGYVRYDRAMELLTGAALSGTLSHAFLLRSAARDLKNDVVDPYPLPYEGGQDGRPPGYIRTANSINRHRTRSCAVFRGVLDGEDSRLTTIWTVLGEPVCSVALPAWPLAGAVPPELGGPATAPLCDAAIVKEEACYPLATSPEYIDTSRLDDGAGGGVFSFTAPIEDWALARAETFLAGWRTAGPTPATVSAAQNELATQAYWCLLASSVPNDALSAPRDLTCRTLENRSLLLREYIHDLAWQAPVTGSAAAYRVYDASSGSRVLLAELAPGSLSYLRRRVARAGAYIYAVLAVDGSGAEGSPACVEPGAAAAAGKTARTAAQGAEAISRFALAFRRLSFIRPL
jgi:hypothetical protein